jgi:transposase
MNNQTIEITSERIDDIPVVVERIEKATAALDKLAAKPGDDIEQLWLKVAAILKRHRVKEFFAVETTTETITQHRYVGRGRPTATSQPEQITRRLIQVNIQSQSAAIEQARQLAGWRLYVTNTSTERLTLSSAVIYYRDEWLLERGFHRVKRGHLPALPIYFQNQDRIVGLMFLLMMALRVFTLIEFVVRQALHNTEQS